MPVTSTPQTHDAPRTGAAITHDYPRQIIRRAWQRLRVSPGKIIVAQTKSALHRTRLQVLHHENFSVLFFYKRYGQPARLLAFCRSSPTEKSEKNFSDFQFIGSEVDPG
ncbi:hypothetical protein [Pantoea sp.]|uniref:hypothetical protein n=1 Tax=Pantoea sp. TaxID=69393 RepID=UPI002908B466|nr:hypothetical protein [Pantoea sp.]MDU4128997.1 hypothetical protein [Pantoea sp.]